MTIFNRWDPYRQMDDLTRLMDSLWENSRWTAAGSQGRAWSIPLDVLENNENFVVLASLPGVKPDDIEVTFKENTLSIQADVQMDETGEDEQVHLRERRFGRFAREINLPTHIAVDEITASYNNGVLVLMLPKSEQARPKRIAVKPGTSTKVLEGSFENLASKN